MAMGSPTPRIGPDLMEVWEEDADPDDDWACTFCGGDGTQETDDYFEDGADIVDCRACGGTGERKHQTIF